MSWFYSCFDTLPKFCLSFSSQIILLWNSLKHYFVLSCSIDAVYTLPYQGKPKVIFDFVVAVSIYSKLDWTKGAKATLNNMVEHFISINKEVLIQWKPNKATWQLRIIHVLSNVYKSKHVWTGAAVNIIVHDIPLFKALIQYGKSFHTAWFHGDMADLSICHCWKGGCVWQKRWQSSALGQNGMSFPIEQSPT